MIQKLHVCHPGRFRKQTIWVSICHDPLPVVVATGVLQWGDDVAADTASFIKLKLLTNFLLIVEFYLTSS